MGICTPLSVWFFLPFLRGKQNRDDKFYGLFACSKNRLFGICGARDDQQLYGQVEGFDNEAGTGGNKTLGDGVELT